MDIEKKKELWHKLDTESERAFLAFETYRNLPGRDRSVLRAYRRYVDNPLAVKPSDTWSRWSSQYAWRERARAHDAHLDRIRQRSIEKAIEEEAERYAREVEKTRYHCNELMAISYTRAIEWLEDSEWAKSNLRSGDVVKIIALHLEATEKLAVAPETVGAEGDWEEDEVEDPEIDRLVEEVDAAAEADVPEEGLKVGEEDSEESEDAER